MWHESRRFDTTSSLFKTSHDMDTSPSHRPKPLAQADTPNSMELNGCTHFFAPRYIKLFTDSPTAHCRALLTMAGSARPWAASVRSLLVAFKELIGNTLTARATPLKKMARRNKPSIKQTRHSPPPGGGPPTPHPHPTPPTHAARHKPPDPAAIQRATTPKPNTSPDHNA